MRHIVLVSCTKKKEDRCLPAFMLYKASPWFRAMWDLALVRATDPNTDIFILSAKHGLLVPTDCIEPYEAELPRSNIKRAVWASGVCSQLLTILKDAHDEEITFWFYTGFAYRNPLSDWLSAGNATWTTRAPFARVVGIQAQIAAAGKHLEMLQAVRKPDELLRGYSMEALLE